MINTDILFKQLISKITGCPESSFENKRRLKKCQAFLRQYHSLEVNPKFVNREIEQLCDKLDINSLNYKSLAVKKMFQKIIKNCDYSLDLDNYLLMYGIVLFLLELNGNMVNSCEYQDIVENDEILISEDVNWAEILTKSDDIVSLTRDDYGSDESSECFSDESDLAEEQDIPSGAHIIEPPTDTIPSSNSDYQLIKSESWDKSQLNKDCIGSLQPEYWMDNCDTRTLSKSILKSNSKRNFSVFIDDWEAYIVRVNPLYYSSEYRNRIEISEYQLIREIIDVLMGSYQSFVFKAELDSNLITKNRFKISKSIKLLNLSWGSVDGVLQSFSGIATSCLIVRVSCSYIIRNNSLVNDVAPTIVAFGERLHCYLNEFSNVLLGLENQSRGNVGLSLFELMGVVDVWTNRVRLLAEIVVCVSCGRFDALRCKSTVVTLLNLLYKLMNESCLVLADHWVNACLLDLFYHSFKPYLYSLDALLSGQVHIRPQNLFLIPKPDSKFHRNDILAYWNSNFTFKKPTHDERLLNDIPVLLQPFIIQLISTIKAIDLLHVLSIELTKPSILNAIISEPGRFIENFNPARLTTVNASSEIVPLYKFQFHSDFILPRQNALLNSISNSLVDNLSLSYKREITNNNEVLKTGDDLVDACRNLHSNLLLNILDRYTSINTHLISVFINDLGLKRVLNALKSTYFFQAGVEMHDFCSYIFDMVCNFSYDSVDLRLNFNLKLEQILSESINPDLRAEAHRFSILLPSDTVPFDNEINCTHATLPHITIRYDAEWNLRLLITDDILDIANKCFRFLLQLKFAQHCLETTIHTERSGKGSWTVSSNRVCSLRLKLLQIINNFHAYVMNTFIVPSWESLDCTVNQSTARQSEDFTDFIGRISNPFRTMLRGCLQSNEMSTIEKAVRKVVLLGIEASQLDLALKGSLIRELEEKYNRLIDFISAMFRSLAHLGISIGELDVSAFK